MELVLRTEFLDVFLFVMNALEVAHLHQTVGDEHTNAKFVRSIAIMKYDGGRAAEKSVDALVQSENSDRQIF